MTEIKETSTDLDVRLEVERLQEDISKDSLDVSELEVFAQNLFSRIPDNNIRMIDFDDFLLIRGLYPKEDPTQSYVFKKRKNETIIFKNLTAREEYEKVRNPVTVLAKPELHKSKHIRAVRNIIAAEISTNPISIYEAIGLIESKDRS